MRRRIFTIACAMSAILTAKPVFAQQAVPQPAPQGPVVQPKAPPVITLPVVTKDEGAKYPQQAIDDKVTTPTEVLVILVVDASGAVTSATVETPGGHGFDEAAIEAAKKLVLEPAKRDGKPIAAKIRHRYTFTPPKARLVGRIATQLRDAPIEGATVTAVGPDGTTRTATTGADGGWKIDDLSFGKWTLTMAAGGYDSQTDEEQLDPGTEARVEMRLSRPELRPTPQGATADGGAPAVEDVQEVTVKGEKPPREVTKRTLEQRELERIPGTNGDALRAIQNLPGIARSPGLAGLLIVRGAAPAETGTYIDGTYVPLIYHFGGLSSVIPTEMLDKIDFYPGNFSSYFGRHSGGVVDVGVKDPEVKKQPDSALTAQRAGYHALVQADFIDVRGLVQGPVGDTGWKFELAGRRSYVDLWLGPLLTQLGSDVSTAPRYYDYQAVLQRTWDHGKHNVRFFFFGSDDRLAILTKQVNSSAPALTGSLGLGTAFYRMQARYIGKLSDDFEIHAVMAVGKDAIQLNIGEDYFKVTDYPVSGRLELQQKMAAGVRNNVGIDVLYEPYTVDLRVPPIPTPGQPPAGPFGSQPPLTYNNSSSLYQPAIYDEFELTPYKGTRIVPGVRLDYTNENKSWDLQPRFVARQELVSSFPKTTLKGGIGRFANPPQPQDTNPVFGKPGTRSTITNQYGFGGEQEFTRHINLSLEGFYRQYDGVIVSGQGNVGSGRAYGIEALLRYTPDEHFFGFIAYTLSRSVRQDGPGQPEHLFQYDQPHILTAVGSYRLGGGWELGLRFRYVSGNLITPQTYGFLDASSGAQIPSQAYPIYGTREPAFHQLDLRVDKSWFFQEGVKMSAYLDLLNAYNQPNVEGESYNYNSTLRTYATGIPILPSIGFRIEM